MRDELILDNVKLIYLVLKKMGLQKYTDDLYDIGLIGLVGAANTYDPDKGYKFSTYATKCIKNDIMIYLRKLQTETRKANYNVLSLNTIINDDDKHQVEFIDTIPDDFDMEEHILQKDRLNRLSKAIKTLSEREKLLLRYYYGTERKTQKEIAKLLDTSQANVSRLIIKIIKKLRKIVEGESYD